MTLPNNVYKFLCCLLIFYMLFINTANAQLDTIPINNDKAFLINSKALNEQRSIWVHLPNVFDSMGEAYMKKGETRLAIENYEKSIALNPNNKDGKEILKKLNGEK